MIYQWKYAVSEKLQCTAVLVRFRVYTIVKLNVFMLVEIHCMGTNLIYDVDIDVM